jgi:hypothetical protein
MKYIGVRSCSCLPENDDEYMGSSKILGEAMQETPESFTKTIIDTFSTREIANINEQWLHETYDVARNSMFYNLCIAPVGFNMCGRTFSDATRKKQSIVKMGSNNPNYGKKHSLETLEKMSKAKKGKKRSTETRKKISAALSGENSPMYGKSPSPETREKISAAKKGIPKAKIICPYCSKLGGSSAMKRWHFANCKEIS